MALKKVPSDSGKGFVVGHLVLFFSETARNKTEKAVEKGKKKEVTDKEETG